MFGPNPPPYIVNDEEDILHVVLEAKHEIVVARPRDFGNTNFYSYNVVGGFWKNSEPKPSKRALCCDGRAAVVGNTFSHDLEKNVWLQESTRNILGVYEFLDATFRSGFLHLCDKKFCLILRSALSNMVSLRQIPFHFEVEDRLNGRFSEIYMSLVDGVIKGFHEKGKKNFKCSLSSLLEREPYGCKATYK
ncbi:hypothetical protein ACB092_07G201400 [Castanea dentata]